MSTTNDFADLGKSIREEVQHLFGLRWDRFIEWIVIGWLSAWLWSSWIVANEAVFPSAGPIEWVADVVRILHVAPPNWLTAIPAWLGEPSRAWLLWVFIAGAAIAATFAVRSWAHTGLRVLALLCALLALEIAATPAPLVAIVLLPAIPAGAAAVIGLWRDRGDGPQLRESFYFPRGVWVLYLTHVLFLFASPALAPAVLLVELIRSFKANLPDRPEEELSSRAAESLLRTPQRLADADAFTVVSAVAAALAASPDRATAQRVAAAYDPRRIHPIGARSLSHLSE